MGTKVKNTHAGYQVGSAVSELVGFHGATPVAQSSGASQAAITPTIGVSVATTASTNSSPYGFAQAQADALVARVNQLLVDSAAQTTLINALRAALVTKGLVKGAA